MKELLEHGFLDVKMNDSFTNICDMLPRAYDIARVGPEQQIQGRPWRFLDRCLTDSVRVGWSIGELMNAGSYGKIYHAHRMTAAKRAESDTQYEIVSQPVAAIVKQTCAEDGAVLSAEEITTHTSESLVHVFAWRIMAEVDLPWAVPRPYEVFGHYDKGRGWRAMSLGMSLVRGTTLQLYLQKHWSTSTKEANAALLLDILAHVAVILYHLQHRLLLNHRDLKTNNLMLRRRRQSTGDETPSATPAVPTAPAPVTLRLNGLTLSSMYEVTLIDFGFSCVGCPPPKPATTLFQASTWFPASDYCCKKGRDIAQLLYCIHCFFPFDDYLPVHVASVFRQWLQVPTRTGVVDLLAGFGRGSGSTGPVFDADIYEFLRRSDVDPVACEPAAVFRAIHALLHKT